MIPTLCAQAERLRPHSLLSLFQADPRRAERLTLQAAGLVFDFSKQRIDAEATSALLGAAEEAGVHRFIARWFAGEPVNTTEQRPALHMALRDPGRFPAQAPLVSETEQRLVAFMRSLRAGAPGWPEPVRAVVHIGIGGSDLGPRLLWDALKPLRRPGFQLRFAGNVDGAEIKDALEGLDPARTLVVVVSKTFTTAETMANAMAVQTWLIAALGEQRAQAHMAAVSAAPERAVAWGVAAEQVFPFWDWVGGRYSLWSAVSLAVRLGLEEGAFTELLAGAAAMDAHLYDAPWEANAPLLGALVQSLNRIGFGAGSYALLPYARRLALLPAWAQQLEMESNGKGVDVAGRPLGRAAAAVTWGGVGTDAQHSFFQMLHQGVEVIPCEFLVNLGPGEGPGEHRTVLLANAIAQAEALLRGKPAEAALAEMRAKGMDEAQAAVLAPHRAFTGDRPSTLIGLPDLSARTLGALLAYYEHRTVLQAACEGVNPFDQWGVELGKEMAGRALEALRGTFGEETHDPSTSAWLRRARAP
ncbi:MAG: glucose-6-phosphate isomerase [Hyphomonadaceae bacterium]|nr:glucose-6-phosphate isomerase [Hyphomonadaceae bacterium]